MIDPRKPEVTISYCSQCNWLLRSGWMAQELLSSFGQDLGSVRLVPASGGLFRISIGDVVIWDRKARGGFSDARQLKQAVRDHVWPGRDPGHVNRSRQGDDDDA